ncbi:MAG: hypothetical protein NZ937_01365 [Armatimonadetes bacterium]|nr:hypothetical protein [Armatimonadota bacterium]
MLKKWLTVTTILLVAISVFFVFWLWKGKEIVKRPEVKVEKPESKPKPGITLEGVEGFVLFREGRKSWELFVDVITIDKNQTQADAEGIRKAIYYDEKGKPLLWFSAQSLVYNTNTGEANLVGNIQIEAQLPEGKMLIGKVTQAIWHEKKRSLEVWDGQGQVGDIRFFVRKVHYNPDTTVLEAFGQVLVFTPKARLICPMVRANLTTRQIIAFPPVQLTVFSESLLVPIQPVSFQKVAQNQQNQKPEKDKRTEEKKQRLLNFRTDKIVNRKPPKWFFEDVVITEEGENYTITAKRAIYDEDTEKVEIPEGIKFEDPETIATAPKGEMDNRQKVAVFLGPVEVIIKPKKEAEKPKAEESKNQSGKQPEEQKDKKQERLRERVRKEGGKMTCDRAEYYYRERKVIAIGNVKFEQEGRYSGKADKVTYLTREEILTIEGNVLMRDLERGHEVECPKIVINLQTDEVDISPPIKGRLIVREEEEEEKEEQKPPPEKPKQTEKPNQEKAEKEAR